MSSKSVASASLASASKAASVSLSRSAASASSALSSASAMASAAAADAGKAAVPVDTAQVHRGGFMIAAIVITVLALAAAGLYFSGQAEHLFVYFAKKFYKAEAKAEAKALEKVEGEKAEAFLKDRLKNNPMMGKKELEEVQHGLGSEAAKEGLAGISGKFGSLGKL